MDAMAQNSPAMEAFVGFIRAFLSPAQNAPERQQGTLHEQDAKRGGYRAK
ncbi:hypothetical protein AMTRI_Chr08g168670 [Amborella trichopoda]